MKYNLVALFDDESNEFIELSQKKFYKKYRLYKTNHEFYIHLQTLIDPDMDKLNKVVKDILTPYKNFKIQINPKPYLDKSFKNVNLKIEKKGYITRIARNITDTLILSGFNLQNESNKDLCIFLSTSNYSIRKSMNQKISTLSSDKNNYVDYKYAKVNRFELRKPINNKKEVLIKDYVLRHF